MKVLRQFIKEFIVPTIIGLIWTYYSYKSSGSVYNFTTIIKDFSTSFFLTSWFGGQILRIIKQQKVESNLNSIISEVKTLVSQLTETNEKIKVVGLGSKSFMYMKIAVTDNLDYGQIQFATGGEGPVYDCSGYYIDLNGDTEKRFLFDLGNITEHSLIPKHQFYLDKKGIRINCFYSTRGGHFAQVLRMKYVNGVWKRAIHVSSFENIIFTKCDKDYPLVDNEEIRLWGEKVNANP